MEVLARACSPARPGTRVNPTQCAAAPLRLPCNAACCHPAPCIYPAAYVTTPQALMVVVMEFCDLGALRKALKRRAFVPHGKWTFQTTYVSAPRAARSLPLLRLLAPWACLYAHAHSMDSTDATQHNPGLTGEPAAVASHMHALPCPSPPRSAPCCARPRKSPRAWSTSMTLVSLSW